MSALAYEQVFRYPFPSRLDRDGATRRLRLATYRTGKDANPFFFEGRLANPQRTAELLRAVMTVVQSRFHIPAAMLGRILAEADPVVTANDDRLRFEGFSACCGAYARLDLLPDSFDGDVCGRGTTNVDFNQPMLAALSRVKRSDDVSLAVGADNVVLKKAGMDVVEKKVKLPVRWMKGFVEVQAVQSRMHHVHHISAIHALRFFRSLPRMKTHRRATFVARSGQGLRLAQVESKDGVRVGGLERLRVLESLARNADALDVYADPMTGASGWALSFSDCRFHLTISPEVWRGFSGEGQALQSLATADESALPKVIASLKWQSVIDRDELARTAKLKPETIDGALKMLGTRGLVGFDLAEQAYFHREMPFDISQVERLQPRLIAARKLLDADKIQLRKQTKTSAEFVVAGSGVEHRVSIRSGKEASFKCTCPWHNKHGVKRGPCKHILAADDVGRITNGREVMAKKKTAKKKTVKKKPAKKTSHIAGHTKKKSAKKMPSAKKKTPKHASKTPASRRPDDLESVRSELQKLLEKPNTGKKVLKLLLSLDENQRRELSPICQKRFREARKNDPIEDPPGTFRQNPLLPPACIAVFCTGNFTEIKKLGRWGARDSDLILEVVEARKPAWVAQFVELVLGRSYYWNSWRLCREFVRRGLCPKPNNPRYYTGMITGLTGRWNRGKRTALSELRKDPGLLKDEIWRLFEYDGEDDNTLANIDRWESSNWSGAMVTLSKEGKLPRAKLLDSAIDALELGFNHYRARWFFDFFDRMKPTDQEIKKRATRILGLIGSPTPNIAQWAFEKQKLMLDRGLVKVTSNVVNANAPLLGGRHKKTVIQALDMFDQLAQKSRKSAHEVCLTTAEALSHEKADVQKAAFKLIEKYGSPDDRDLHEAVEKYASVAAATVKKQLNAWLATGADVAAKPQGKKQAASKSATKRGNLKRFDSRDVELINVLPLVAASERPPSAMTPIPAAVFDGADIPRLDPSRKLAPIGDLDELLETLGRVIEDDDLIDDAERCIDGLARLHADKPDDFEKLIAPLYKRANKLLERKWSPFAGQGAIGDVCGLICAWKRGEPVTMEVKRNEYGNERAFISGLHDEPIENWHLDGVPLVFLSRRMLDVCELLTSNKPIQLLSSPSHQGGWIDAETLVERINASETDPPESDVILALLRLAPDGRQLALENLKPKLKGEWINAVKHGLGASGIRIGKSAALWAAAARCRTPLHDDPKVAKAFPKLGPGAGKAARFEARFRQEQTKYGPAREFAILTSEKLPKKTPTNIPSQLLQLNRDDDTTLSFHDIGTTSGSVRWLATMWPAAHETFFAAGAVCIGGNLDWWEAEWHNRCFMEPLLDSDTPLLAMGEILLLCGLAAKEPGEHGLAVDIAIQAINDGRLGTDNMARMLATGVTSGHFNLTRLAKRLQDIANTSDLHAYVVMHSAETALPNADAKELPRGIGDICELLLEIGTQIDRGIDNPECRSFLKNITGSNKTAKAARQLLSIESSFDSSEIIETAIENRVDRLKEWAKRK